MNLQKGQQLYIYNKNNALLNAACEAVVKASALRPLVYPTVKQGTGNIAITGDFTGADDAVYDVKVEDTAFENPHVSAPIFKGAGTGKISGISVAGIAAQKITILCKSTGIDTARAEVEIGGLKYRAKTGGAAGNDIYITVDDSGLVFTPADYSLIKELKVGDTALDGAEWDFDTKAMSNDLVPDAAHRVSFGGNTLDIYLQYKKSVDGEWKYYFLPQIRRDVPVGSRVNFVTGGRTVTVTDGAPPAAWNDLTAYTLGQYVQPVTPNNRKYRCTTAGTSGAVEPTWPATIGGTVADGTAVWTCEAYIEQYTDIETMADFWHAIKDASTLIEPVASSIDASRKASSPVVQEFAIKTDAYYYPPYAKSGSSKYAGRLNSIFVTNDAKTELIELECIDNAFVGEEVWNVKGSASGDMGQAQSGIPVNFGPVGFTIPQALPKDWGQLKADWSYRFTPVKRETGIDDPALCFDMKLGISSIPQTLTLEYKKKPVDCICPPVKFSDTCLGLTPCGEGGEIGMAYTVPDLSYWLNTLYDRMVEASKIYESGEADVQAKLKDYMQRFDILARRIMALTEDDPTGLAQMVTDLKALANSITLLISASPPWEATHAYALNALITPTTPNGYVYKVVTAGTSGSVEPTWPTTIGQYVWDGTVQWRCHAVEASGTVTWDDATSTWTDTFDGAVIADVRYNLTAYSALVDDVLDYEKTYGIKKNSVAPPGTCWKDSDAEFYWEVRGSKPYLPAYTDLQYYSTVMSGDVYLGTKEFAFLISTPCSGLLEEGDIITVTIGGTVYERTYQLGDITYLPTIAAHDLYMRGGVDGDDTYIFSCRGDIDAFPDFLLDRDNPLPYSETGLAFTITDGIVGFSVGDYFEFNVEGGHWQWRKDGGAWSASLNIEAAPQALDEGLQIAFSFGTSPSFVTGDTWEIICRQSGKASNMADTSKLLSFSGEDNVPWDMGVEIDADTLVLDLHNLTSAFTLQASNISDFSVLEYEKEITPSPLICHFFTDIDDNFITISARYWRIVQTGDVQIGYCFIGKAMQLGNNMDAGLKPMRRFSMDRSRYQDMPFYFVPNLNFPEDCLRARIDTDNIGITPIKDENVSAGSRLYSLSFNVIGEESIGVFLNAQKGYTVEYDQFIYNDDFQKLDAMFLYLKTGL